MKLTTKQHETGLKLQTRDQPEADVPDAEMPQRSPDKDRMGTAEVLNVRSESEGVFVVDVRCPYCMCLHIHRVRAANLDELRKCDEVLRWRHCGATGAHIAGIGGKYDLLAYKLRGFADLDDEGWHIDLESADPHGFFFIGPYDVPARITAAVSLIRATPGLTGFDIEHFHPTPVAKLVRHEADGVQRNVLMLTVQFTDTDETQAVALEGDLQLVLQRHQLINDRYRYSAHDDVLTYDDPGFLLREVHNWLNDTQPQAA